MSRTPIATLSIATKEDREMASTKDVVDHHLKCFGERDLKGILFDYAPGAVLFTSDGPLRGADAIRPLFQGGDCGVWKTWRNVQDEAAVCRGSTVPTFCGRQKPPTTCARWARTRSSCETARS